MSENFKFSYFRVMLVIGLFQVAAYWFSGSMACSDGVLAVPQYDTPLYYQAARRIVEGHPFSYSEGSATCTGTTTVLYPFLLAIPYALGATGESLLWAGFIVNALCYLVFLYGWSVAVKNWCQSSASALLASILIALSGHCAYVTFSQSDIGFLLAYTALLAAALSTDRRWAIGVLLALGPWVRPEGMICCVAYCMITFACLVAQKILPDLREKVTATDFLACVVSIVSCFGVFALNYALTGHVQFSSIAGKGYFAQLSFPMAVFTAAGDFIKMFKELFGGSANGVPREFISIPCLGAVLLAVGIVSYNWTRHNIRGLLVLMLAALGCLLSVAQSGFQGTNLDRYVVWMFPIVIVLVAEATVLIERRFMPKTLCRLPSALVVTTSVMGTISLVIVFNAVCRCMDSSRLFAYECDKIMPPKASFGCDSECDMAYHFSPRRCVHVGGVYTSELKPNDFAENLERLRHRPELRFDYWIFSSSFISSLGEECVKKMGEVLLSGPDAVSLAKANWLPFEICSSSTYNGKVLVASVDIGYEADEKFADYNVITRWGIEEFRPFIESGRLDEKFIVDVGRVILGGDEMSVPLKPGCDAIVVMRTWPSHVVPRKFGYPSRSMDCAFSNPLKFNIAVDGEIVDTAEISYATNVFSDVSFKIPGSAIKNAVSRIGFLGDHITFGYWFYQ